MTDINFSVKDLNLIGSDGYATIDSNNTIEINSKNYLNLNADTVGISTDITIGGQVASDLIIAEGFYLGVGTDNPTSSIDVKGIIKATSFVGDGSGLIGVVGSGSGVVIKDSGSTVGTAGTIDFGDNLTVSPISAGVVTVTASGGGTSSQWITTAAGIHTLSNVGIGSTIPTSALTVVGSGASLSQLYVTGVSTFGSNVIFDGTAKFNDLKTLDFGTDNDLRIWHDGTTNIIKNQTGSSLEINLGSNSNSIFSVKNQTQTLARFYRDALVDGRVELYYNDSNKFETIGTGVTVTGTTFTNQLSVSGVSTFSGSNNYFSGSIICSTYAGTSRVILTGGTGGDTNFYNGGTSYSDFIFTAFQGGASREIARINKNGVLSLPYADGGLNVVGVSTFIGNVGVGTTNPTSALTVSGLTSTTSLFSTNSATIDGLLISQDSLTGTGNIRIGDSNTLGSSTDGNYNIAIGQEALDNIRNGDNNIAIGYQAAQQANIGDIGAGNNISIGYRAFKNLKSGSTNVAIGNQSLYGTTTSPSNAGGNVSIGNGAGYFARSVRFNALIGENSGYKLDTGDWNTFLGWESGYNITSGNYNIYLGSVNGKYSSVGENRIVIGNGNGSFSDRKFDAPTSGSKQLAIGFNTSGTSEYWLVGNSSLDIGIGTTNPQYKLDVGGNINFTGTLYQNGVAFSGGGGSSGVGVQDDGSSVGTATTINFGTGLSVSAVSAGIVTVTAIPTNNFYDGGVVTGNIVLTTANKNQLVPVSTGSSISITLPAGSGLSAGDGFAIVDVGSSETSSGNAATYNITVTPNAADRIMGGTGPLIIDENGASVKLVWMGSTYDWRIV